MQSIAVQITVIVALVITGCFAWVLTHTRGVTPLAQIAVPAYRARAWLFTLAIAAGAVISFLTLVPWPHDAGAADVTRHIDVTGQQWAWQLSDDKAQVGDVVEFRVTSLDVNHGFALYDTRDHIVAQVQAMPGYVNKVRYRFTEPGKYRVLCMEYCGLAHHGMVAEIDVQPPRSMP